MFISFYLVVRVCECRCFMSCYWISPNSYIQVWFELELIRRTLISFHNDNIGSSNVHRQFRSPGSSSCALQWRYTMETEPTGARPNGSFIWCSGALDHDRDFQKLRTSNPSKDLPENTNSSLVFKALRATPLHQGKHINNYNFLSLSHICPTAKNLAPQGLLKIF